MASNSYYAKTYDEWKKKWGVDAGTKVEGMTDNDYALGLYLQGQDEQRQYADDNYNASMSSLQRQYQQGTNTLNQAYNANLSQLEASKKTSEQNADILHQKMQKYLGTQADAAGMSGTGYASPESLKLRANASYNQNLGNIAANYNTNKTSLDNQRLSGLSELENAYMTGEEKATSTRNAAKAEIAANNTNKLLSMYSEEVAANKADEEQNKADIETSYDTYAAKGLSAINNANMDGASASAYLESIKDSLRAEDYAYLKSMVDAKIAKEQETADDTDNAEIEASYDNAYKLAASYLDNARGTKALEYIDAQKDVLRPEEYNYLRSLALEKIYSENEVTNANTEAENESKLAQAYSDFVTAYNAGVFASTNDAIDWAKKNGIENYSIVNQLAKAIDQTNSKNADAVAEAEKVKAQAEALQTFNNNIGYMTDGDSAWALLDSLKDKLSETDYLTAENAVKLYFGERNAMTLERFVDGESYNNYKFKSYVTEDMLDDNDFLDAVEKEYGTDNLDRINVKDGTAITFTTGKGKNAETHTWMYVGGQWCDVKNTSSETADNYSVDNKNKDETVSNSLQKDNNYGNLQGYIDAMKSTDYFNGKGADIGNGINITKEEVSEKTLDKYIKTNKYEREARRDNKNVYVTVLNKQYYVTPDGKWYKLNK